jgi:hypothetical protein
MSDIDLDELRAELDDFAEPEKKGGRSAREERIIAGFDEIQRFVEKNGRAPQHGEDRDIFERLYAVRLDRLLALQECRSLLAPLDRQGLLAGAESAAAPVESIDEDELLAELGGAAGSCARFNGRYTRTKRAVGLPIRLPVRFFPTSTQRMIRPRARSTYCEVSRTIR